MESINQKEFPLNIVNAFVMENKKIMNKIVFDKSDK